MKKSALIIISTIIITVITAFAKSRMIRVSSGKENGDNYGISFTAALHDSISKIVSEYPGQIGVAPDFKQYRFHYGEQPEHIPHDERI